ncbi:putative Zn-finger in Ran binding protein [Leishmania utingensis]|uniref:Zn-finger in Ran binding protein n=1 Tax=Leishmania utingensis TaxID=653362 RepID=A0AAW3ATJ6_9TRYP
MLQGYSRRGARFLRRPCGVTAVTVASQPATFGEAPKMALMSSTVHASVRPFFTATPLCLARRLAGNQRRQRNREPTKGDWQCQCGEVNYYSKRECYKCGAPAPPLPPGVRRPNLPGEDPHDWACPCGQMNFRGSVLCHKCQQPKPVPPPLPGKETTLWTCPKCKGVNRNTRKFCFKCSVPSPLVEFKPQQ